MTPGEMLAKKLTGDSSISSNDIKRATVEFFTSAGCNCEMGSKQPDITAAGTPFVPGQSPYFCHVCGRNPCYCASVGT